MPGRLSRLIKPRSIAVIGGGAWGRNVVEQCLRMGFDGPIWPVHPTKPEIGGVPAFARPQALPAAPDAVFVGVNRSATIETVRLLRDLGAGGAVCFASGFREAQAEMADGADLQEALLEAAGDMPIIGPNCYGFINYLDGALLWPDQHGGERVERGVALLTQSSNIAINLTMQARGLPLAYVATAGNQAQTGLSEIGAALLADDRVTALGLHIEGIGDIRAFEALAATARALGKPIVALKAGKSLQAQAAAVSHTASLTGSDAGARALLRRLGIAQVDSVTALLETLKLLHFAGPLAANTLAVLSSSGGEASLMADTAQGRSITLTALNASQHAQLRQTLGPKVALANPLDYHTYIWDDVDKMAQVFATMLSGEAALGCVIVDFPRADRCDPTAWDCVIEAGARAAAHSTTPLALLATLPEALSEAVAKRAIAGGLIPMHGLDDALTAVEAASYIGAATGDTVPVLLPGAPHALRTVTEAEAKAALAAHGLAIPASHVVHDAEHAGRAAAEIGFPVVLKGSGVAHKTEAGLVALSLTCEQDVIDAANAMGSAAFVVEEMVENSVCEVLIGVQCDPAHGYVLTLGAGGTLTEILQDTVSMMLPVAEAELRTALASLRMAPLLRGYRGQPGADIAAIVHAVMAVQDYVTAQAGGVAEVEINPLICMADGAVAADALIEACRFEVGTGSKLFDMRKR